jgi:hypothetical protein
MSLLGALFVLAGFVAILRALKLISKGVEVATVSRRAFADFSNPNLDDDTKEAAMQSHAKRLFSLFLLLFLGTSAALLLPLCIIYIFDFMGILSFHAVIDTAVSWEFLAATTTLSLGVLLLVRKR